MPIFLFGFLTLVLSSPAMADGARPRLRQTEKLPCAQVQAFVAKYGEVIVYSKARFSPVDVYQIVHPQACQEEVTDFYSSPYFISTLDQARCRIGFICVERAGD